MIFGYEKVDRFQIDDEIFYRYTIFIVKLNFDREGAEIMEKDFTLNEVSIMTGLTTRTLRNYLKMNMLSGEKREGTWYFTEEDISELLSNPNIRPGIQAKKRAVVFDFLAETKKKYNEICTILDLQIDDDRAEKVTDFFCGEINKMQGEKIAFSFEKAGKSVRVILRGNDCAVMKLLNAYYGKS